MGNITDKFTNHLKSALTQAITFAVDWQQPWIEPEHLLLGVVHEKGCVGAEILRKAKVNVEALQAHLRPKEIVALEEKRQPELSESSKRVIEKAILVSALYGHGHVGTEHLISGIFQVTNKPLASYFETQDIQPSLIHKQLDLLLRGTQSFPDITVQDHSADHVDADISDVLDGLDTEGSMLERYATELTTPDAETDLDPVIGRDQEITRMMEILSRRTKNNPILVGEPGVGKTAIVEGLARKIVMGEVPSCLQDKRVFSLDLGVLVAGAIYRGEFEARLKQIIDEVREQPDVILFVDEIHTVVGAGSASGSLDAANMLKPALARGWIRCIGATTSVEYKKFIEADRALERRFQRLDVKEPNVEETIEILRGLSDAYARHHNIIIEDDALIQAARLSHRYIHGQHLPDKAIDLLDEAAASKRVQHISPQRPNAKKNLSNKLEDVKKQKREAILAEHYLEAGIQKQKEQAIHAELEALDEEQEEDPIATITRLDILTALEKRTGIPLNHQSTSARKQLERLRKTLKTRLFGQDHVIDEVVAQVKRAQLGIQSLERPLASFLFVGPTGTGKTELAHLVAEHVFNNRAAVLRLDMSEFIEGHSVAKLIGSPAGYVGYRESARLTDSLKHQPQQVILFDEIEKAHTNVQQLLLQMLEHGEITDATGQTISIRSSIIILTSNAGAELFLNVKLGFHENAFSSNNEIQSALTKQFRPELLNRLDRICLFKPLNKKTRYAIAKKALVDLENHLAEQEKKFSWTPELIRHIASLEDIERTGARTIRQNVEKYVSQAIVDKLLEKPELSNFSATINKNRIDLKAKTR